MPQTPRPPQRKQDSELLIKGVICALIGAVLLIGPYVTRSPDMREILSQAYVVGWFALILGAALIVRYGLNRRNDKS